MAEFPSQPDHFLLASQPEHDREGPDPREGLIGAWPESPQPISLPRDFSTEQPYRQGSRGLAVDAWLPSRCLRPPESRVPFLSTQRWTMEGWFCDFSKKLGREWEHLCPGLCSGCSSGHSLEDVIWSHPAWGALWQAFEKGASGRCPRRQGAQARQGAREGLEAWATGGLLHTLWVLKCLGRPKWLTQQGGLWTTAPLPQTPGPRCLPSVCFGDRPVKASLSSSCSLSVKAAGSMETVCQLSLP